MTRAADVPRVLERLGIRKAVRRGRELWARCPFHDEKTPSFCVRVDPDDPERHGCFRCYGACSGERRGGGLASLVRLVLGLSSNEEARRWMRGEGVPPERPVPVAVEIDASPAAPSFVLPPGVVVAPVASWPSQARRYLVEDRGVPAEQAERWGLGYAAIGRLRGRIVFPLRDRRGRLRSYTARTFVGDPVPFKAPDVREGADADAVYGEERWPPLAGRRVVVVVEAALNGLAVERIAGLPFGGVFGSELLPGHAARLSTFETAIVASDPDKAGAKLAAQLEEALGWRKAIRAALPDGEDPASLALSDPERLARIILSACPETRGRGPSAATSSSR